MSDSIETRAYIVPNWFDRAGVSRKRKLIEAKGLPSFHNWRLITPTIKRERFPGPLEAYLAGNDHMRRFMAAARKRGLWSEQAKWCWKFEFQKDGWPHWHILVDRTKKFTKDELKLINKLWGLGRVNTKRVNVAKFRYDFKYALKSVTQDGEGMTGADAMAPQWFLDYIGSKVVPVSWTDENGVEQSERAQKPVTFARVRFWQTSRGFYTGKPAVVAPPKPQKAWGRPRTVREILDARLNTVQIVARDTAGFYRKSMVVRLTCDRQQFWNLVGFDAVENEAVGLGFYRFMVRPHRIKTDKKTLWQMIPLLEANRLNLRKARMLRDLGHDFRTS